MNRTQTILATALTSAIAFAPMLALADDSVRVDASTDVKVNTKHPLFEGNAGTGIGVRASSTLQERKDAMEASKGERDQARVDKAAARGDKAVDQRISMLQDLEDRISGMKRISSDVKTSLSAQLSAQIAALTSLRAQIDSDTSTTSLIANLKTIRPDYRTFLLVLPQAAITAADDRIMTIVAQMETVGTKLEARITDAKNAGADVSAAETAYTDYQAKIADAKVQAQASIDLIANLKVDNGDADTLAANTAALKSARTKLQAARADLVQARKDMTTIIQSVKGKGGANATTTAKVSS